MADRPKGVPFIRKLSIFFFLFTTLGAFFSFYYLQFIPTNKAELEKRGFRTLKMFATNIISRNNDIVKIFGSQGGEPSNNDSGLLVGKKGVYGQLNSLYPFSVDTLNPKNAFSIDKSATEEWAFYYKSVLKRHMVKIAPADIIGPSLTGGAQVFNSYLLLKKDTSLLNGYDIVFDQNNAGFTGLINLDTLTRLQKNSYQTAILDMNLSGTAYKMFLNPFTIGSQKLILAGLMVNQNYSHLANYAPVGDTLFIIIVVLILIVSLPFIKIFSLSPREKIAFADVIGTAISIFCGSSVIVMIMAALFINYGLNKENTGKLKRIGATIKNDVETEIKLASDQLNQYDRNFNNNCNKDILDLLSKNPNPNDSNFRVSKADALFYPLTYKNIYRVFWVGNRGSEITKWNPFNFYAPLTDVSNHRYYKMLVQQNVRDTPFSFVLYPGLSNVTGEFQVTIARRVNPDSAYQSPKKGAAVYIALSAFFGTSILPVLPKDFGFCIVDNKTGTVLMHSDSKRNLQENIFDETDNNAKLIEGIRYKQTEVIDDIQLYGDPHKLYLVPINGQPLSLIVFYNKSSVYSGMFRIIYFTAEVLFWIYFCIALCVIWHSFSGSKRSKLNFALVITEWFRPSVQNALSYFFTKSYFVWLLFLSTVFIVVNIQYAWECSNVFFLSILTVLFALFGFVISRKKDFFLHEKRYVEGVHANVGQNENEPIYLENKRKERNGGVAKNIFPIVSLTAIVLIIISYMLCSIWNVNSTQNIGYIACFIIAASIVMYLNYYKIYKAEYISKYINAHKEHEAGIKKAYRVSLFTGILLVAIIPTTGILFYGFSAERIQQKKYDILTIATDFQNRENYLMHNIVEKYNTSYSDSENFNKYFADTLIREKGIYIDTKFDSVSDVLTQDSGSMPMPDKLYGFLTEHYSGLTPHSPDNYFMGDSSADSPGWRFEYFNKDGGKLALHGTTSGTHLVYASARRMLVSGWWLDTSNLAVFILLPLLTLCIFGTVCWFLFGQVMLRVFLVDYFPANECLHIDEDYLKTIFNRPHIDESRKLYIYNNNVPSPAKDWRGAFDAERNFLNQYYPCTQEEYILANCYYFEEIFEKMWKDLGKEEKYLLYDLAFDEYTNYRDVPAIYLLLHKGVLIYENLRLQFFSYSFKNYILSKKGSEEIVMLNAEIATPGMWEVLRIPILTLICIVGIFLFITQSDLSHQITALVTTAAALIPILIKLTEKPNNPIVVRPPDKQK